MEKSLLLAGKELPDGANFAAGAVTAGRRTLVTKKNDSEDSAPMGAVCAIWNRPSALSARSLILKSLNEFGHLDECILIFDEADFASKIKPDTSSTEKVRIIEELISSYQYLTMEITSRLQKKSEKERRPLRLIFIYKSNPSLSDILLSKTGGRPIGSPSAPFLSSAAAAFKAYAENTAAVFAESAEILPLLVQCDIDNPLSANDNALSTWLFNYIAALESLRKPLSIKQKLAWIKAGAKSPGGFGFFG